MKNILDNINISESVTTPATGTHTVGPKNVTTSRATAKIKWTDLETNQIESQGSFNFGTYLDSSNETKVILDLDKESEMALHREWKFYSKRPAHNGWAYQDAEITLILIADLNDDEGIISLATTLTVKAYTEGFVHSCTCSAKVERFEAL